ncbi:MAG TPA: hypothetical protein VEW03_11940, partial [Longimicrobiaceae bacterium]|nr:hypothetical protein [Longimicrobiaceae bacterium]
MSVPAADGPFERRLRARLARGRVFSSLFFVATLIGVLALVVLLVDIWRDGATSLSWDFITG